MASPISFGDVVKALEICRWIERYCFSSINNASVLYVGFREDVLHLEKRIKQFQASFETAVEQIQSHDQSKVALLKLESDELVGDFLATLDECKKLLEAKAKFSGERATALDNAWWHSRSQPRVDELRRRLQSHSYKIYLIIEPVQLGLITEISASQQEILTLLRRQFGIITPTRLPQIPPIVDSALTSALSRDCPKVFDGPHDIPLNEAVDALSLHYRECTVGSTSSGVGPDIKQNLSLLKAHWLFNTIESSEPFSQSRPGSLFRRIVEQVGQGIEGQYKSLKISEWADEEFSALDDTAWALWPVKEVLKPQDMTDAAPGEEKVAEIPLLCHNPDQKEVLLVFRVSDKTLRVVKSRSVKNASVGVQMTERFVDLDTDGLIPIYAVASSNVVNMTNGKGGSSVSYEFFSHKSALKVQSAFTGYDALRLSSNVTCAFTCRSNSRLSRSIQEMAIGEIQVWQWPSPKLHQDEPSSPVEASTSTQSRSMYTGSESNASTTFQAFDQGIVSVMQAQDGGDMVVAELPLPPVLVFLVRSDSRYAVWHMDLSQLDIKKNHRQSRKRYRSTLETLKGKPFPLRRLAVNESQLDLWNIRAISTLDISNSKNKKGPIVELLNGESIVLDFTTEQEQNNFEAHFKAAAVRRMKQVEHFKAGRHVAKSQADTPQTKYGQANVRRASTSSLTIKAMGRKDSLGAPKLDPIPSFASFDDANDDRIEVVKPYA